MNNRKIFTLRIEESTLKELHHIASKNKRSVNNQIEILIQNFIDDYVKENGKILVSDEE